jgi:hypothetical protein
VADKGADPITREAVAEHGLAVLGGRGEEDAVGGRGAGLLVFCLVGRRKKQRETL